MKFGKLSNISKVDFRLPNDHEGTTKLLSQLPKNDSLPKVYVGCTGWGMKEWVGHVYPMGAKAKDYLRHYVNQFNTIELNTTHYRIPNEETILKWRTTAPKDFKYSPKLPQVISHSRDLGFKNDNTTRFCAAIHGLQENLGYSFMQLPPYFDITRLPMLERFLQHFPKEIPLAIEVRHEDWFNNATNGNRLFQLLETHKIATVITDVAGRRDVLHQRLTTDIAMIRFVGNDLHSTDYQRIDDWIIRLKKWFAMGLKEVYFFTHEPDNIKAPELAEYFVKAIEKECKVNIRGPQFFQKDGGQMSLF